VRAHLSTLAASLTLAACGAIAEPADGGDDGGVADAVSSADYNTPTVCTSGQGGPTANVAAMRPGEACLSCHSLGPVQGTYPFMGTIYPTAHEPNDCVGASSVAYPGVQVIVTDAQGKTFALTPNASGNFYGPLSGVPVMPYRAKVTYQGRELAMLSPETSGDCNACHTEQGTNGAPGRVVLP